MVNRVFIFLVVILGVQFSTRAQDDLMKMLEEQEEEVTNLTIATFKTTRLVSGHSIETNAEGVLQFLIGHRFGRLNSGWRDLYGIDNATIRLGFEYGITDNINIGVGRSSFEKTYDATFKWRLLRQKSGAKNFPFTATWVSSSYLNTMEWPNPERENYFSSRMNFHHALLLARKFGNAVSVQLMPTLVHRNIVQTKEDENTIYSMGVGSSIRLTGSLRANFEYYFIPEDQIFSTIGGEKVRNSFSVGVDLETGGHVFQIFLTNSRGMAEKFLVGETTGNWLDGDIHFGFNVSRVFTLKKPEELK
ncbi:MAG: hypothetical protein CMC96_05780 [Flavobacteriales bacterium]|nr:hypothetical protein [Flavobacteriales bacterium]|tara:strand:+ start:11041 stop:11952 length:912 start_codon:yes stop_codon:yes gene_type:complete